MKILEIKNFEEIKNEEKNDIRFNINNEGNIVGIKFLGGQEIPIYKIPYVNDEYSRVYFLSKAMNWFIIIHEKYQNLKVVIRIQQTLTNGAPKIQDVYTTLVINDINLLSGFATFCTNGIKKLLVENLPKYLEKLPFVSEEIEWFKQEIIDLYNTQQLKSGNTKQKETNVRTVHIGTKPTKYYDVFGEKLTVREMSDKYGIRQDTLRARLDKGMSVEDAVTMKVQETGWRLRK